MFGFFSCHAKSLSSPYINADMSSIPFDDRVVSALDYATIWANISLSYPVLFASLPLFMLGFNALHVLAIVVLSQSLTAGLMMLNGKAGAKYGLPFVMISRAAFGLRGSSIPIYARFMIATMGHVGFIHIGSMFMKSMLSAWFPSFQQMRTPFPDDLKLDWQLTVCYVLTWLLNFPFAFLGLPRIMQIMRYQNVISVIFLTGLILYSAFHLNSGPLISLDAFQRASPFASNFSFVLSFVGAIVSMTGLFFVFITNYADLARASKSTSQMLVGTTMLPLFTTTTSLGGIYLASVFFQKYGNYGTLSDMISRFENGFLITLVSVFMLAGMLTSNWLLNTSCASMTMLHFFPVLTFRQGSVVAATAALVIYPIISLLLTATTGSIASIAGFLGGVGALTVLMGPLAGILIADYFCLNKRSLDIEELSFPIGKYWFSKGYNTRALLALVLAALLQVPGLTGNTLSNEGLRWVGSLGYAVGFGGGFACYLLISWIWPVRLYTDSVLEMTVHRQLEQENKDANELGL